MGFSFEKLCELGSGEHPHAAIDPYDFRNTGTEPKFASDWESRHAHFQFVLFGYQVGAYTSLEVLAVAREVLAAQRGGEA